ASYGTTRSFSSSPPTAPPRPVGSRLGGQWRRERVLAPRVRATLGELDTLAFEPPHRSASVFRHRQREGRFRMPLGSLPDRLCQDGFALLDMKKADVKSTSGNPRVAGIALFSAFFEHHYLDAAFRQTQARGQAGETATYYSDFIRAYRAHDRYSPLL